MPALESYQKNLRTPRERGTGCHSWIMSTVNLGILAGKDPQEIHDSILQAQPHGIRRGEIEDAIKKALFDHQAGTYTPRPRPAPAVMDGKAARDKIISQGKINDEADLIESSPIRLWDAPLCHASLLLDALYSPDDLLWIGDFYDDGILGDTIRTATEWIEHFKAGGATAPHIIINPLDGIPRPKKTGEGLSLRGDANVKAYRHCVVEFDDLNREDQIKFWSAAKLPIVALIDSGGKSIHAWIEVAKLARVKTLEEWDTTIKQRLYDRLLIPLGVDPACKNASRLSRLPGHFRQENNSMQRLLWLSPEGKQVC